jgi:hypothetical protein
MSESAEMLIILKYIKRIGMRERQFWISIRKAKNCLYSRRNGYIGSIICGYSVVIRLFGHDLLKDK